MKRTSVFMVTEAPVPDRSLELASHTCTACGDNTVVQASMEDPFCAHCGGGDMAPAEAAGLRARTLLQADDTELSSVRCSNSDCRSYVIMTRETAASHADADGIGHINCMACSTPLAYRAPEAAAVSDDDWGPEGDENPSANEDDLAGDVSESTEGDDAPSLPSITVYDVNGDEIARGTLNERDDLVFVIDVAGDDDEVTQQSFSVGSGNDVVEDDDGNIELNDAELIDSVAEDEVEDNATEAERDELEVDADPNTDEGDANESAAAEEAGADAEEGTTEGNAEEAGTEEAEADKPTDEVAKVQGEPMTIALHRVVAGDVAFASYGDLTVCRRGDTVVATLEQTGADGASFANALNLAVAKPDTTLEAVLASNEFDVAEVTLTEEAHVAERVRVATDEAVARVDTQMDNVGERLKQSVGIALASMGRGMFGVTNPLVSAVVAGLVEAGADEETAMAVVSTALVKSGDEFASVVQEQSLKIYAKPDEIRNEMASTLGEAVIVAETASVVTRKSRLASELETPLRASETASVNPPKPGKKTTRIAELAGAGFRFTVPN